MNSRYSLLVVDDEQSIVKLFKKEFTTPRRAVHTASSGRQAWELFRKNTYEIVVLDLRLPDANGLELLTKIRQRDPDIEAIVITGYGNIDSAVEAMKLGAYDYITKPFNLDELELVIERAYQRVCLRRENRSLKHSQLRVAPPSLIGQLCCAQADSVSHRQGGPYGRAGDSLRRIRGGQRRGGQRHSHPQ